MYNIANSNRYIHKSSLENKEEQWFLNFAVHRNQILRSTCRDWLVVSLGCSPRMHVERAPE